MRVKLPLLKIEEFAIFDAKKGVFESNTLLSDEIDFVQIKIITF